MSIVLTHSNGLTVTPVCLQVLRATPPQLLAPCQMRLRTHRNRRLAPRAPRCAHPVPVACPGHTPSLPAHIASLMVKFLSDSSQTGRRVHDSLGKLGSIRMQLPWPRCDCPNDQTPSLGCKQHSLVKNIIEGDLQLMQTCIIHCSGVQTSGKSSFASTGGNAEIMATLLMINGCCDSGCRCSNMQCLLPVLTI